MSEYKSLAEFYPTPPELIGRMLLHTDLRSIGNVLEPSAGKGDIVRFIALAKERESYRYGYYGTKEDDEAIINRIIAEFREEDKYHSYSRYYKDIDCIEIDPTLQAVLKGNDMEVIDDDFLKYDGDKHYDLIIMNPPFSNGDQHLLHAIKIAKKTGGQVICVLNAETIRNPYTNLRKELLKQLAEFNATYEYVKNGFSTAERPSDVEVVIVCLTVPSPFKNKSRIWESLNDAEEPELNIPEGTQDLVTTDIFKQSVLLYKREIRAGRMMFEEYLALKPYITSTFETGETPDYAKGSTLYLTTNPKRETLDWNEYVAAVRYKYWYELLHKPAFMGNLTSNLKNEYYNNIREFAKKDFSLSNIYKVQIDILKRTAQGITDKIVAIFEQLSYRNSMGCDKNIHYFSGWKSNSAFKINPHVVVPWMHTWNDIFKKFRYQYDLCEYLYDLEKCLDFLDGGENDEHRDIGIWLNHYESEQQTRNLHFKYFDIDVYKKGTVHVKFTDMNALKKLNIYGCLHKGWLPPSYGKKAYSDMDQESQIIIQDFEGEESYAEVYEDPKRWIAAPEQNMLLLDA